ncbi:hypothetical protein VOLCADRAFT_89681 [Volvox carteri f. nagariensis]|uniref:SGNH hydrolase-type esterase domain-containing protein n=1 Tax=Volvox carteri f. nagariensis TaxID=3068 RepID=D8TRT2_VOLCA|nr:uncharacterized protein VOLCADRAFT_89681 [Volvox carteri f. nagariensis]EFJ49698.1 hypothetical protein VOLCADRAFT_89681 [Volvox carteri f. nagariensis]|eukprot:XP_002949205.1 hypothetical protein VOLCADRAFT_89681 [Volvox carteri f. nagariensis]
MSCFLGRLVSSITAGQGVGGADHTYIKQFMDWLNHVMPPRGLNGRNLNQITHTQTDLLAEDGRRRRGGSKGAHGEDGGKGGGSNGGSGGVLAVQRQRRRLRTSVKAVGHEFINGAVAGYSSSCLQHHLIPGADLVFVDFAVNDHPTATWALEGSPRRELERLLRKVLNLPSNPAVVLVNMFAMGPSHRKYWYTAERDFMEFATYYSLPAVSLKSAVLPSAYVGGAEEMSLGGIFNGGLNHPGRGGHVVIAEVLITLCTELLQSNARFSGAGWGAMVVSEGAGAGAGAGAGRGFEAALAAVAARPLPPPMGPSNYETANNTCYIEDDLQARVCKVTVLCLRNRKNICSIAFGWKALVQQPVDGWQWTDEGRGKWGYVATEPGKTIKLKVNTLLAGNRSREHSAANIVVQIAHLQSYRGMSTAKVSCVSGCTCMPAAIDAFSSRIVSLTAMKDIRVSQHPECVIELLSGGPSPAALHAERDHSSGSGHTNGSHGDSGDRQAAQGHKFKLMGVVVGEEPGAAAGTVTFIRQESHNLWQRVRNTAGRLLVSLRLHLLRLH